MCFCWWLWACPCETWWLASQNIFSHWIQRTVISQLVSSRWGGSCLLCTFASQRAVGNTYWLQQFGGQSTEGLAVYILGFRGFLIFWLYLKVFASFPILFVPDLWKAYRRYLFKGSASVGEVPRPASWRLGLASPPQSIERLLHCSFLLVKKTDERGTWKVERLWFQKLIRWLPREELRTPERGLFRYKNHEAGDEPSCFWMRGDVSSL